MRRLVENIQTILLVFIIVCLTGTVWYGYLGEWKLAGMDASFMITLIAIDGYIEGQLIELTKFRD